MTNIYKTTLLSVLLAALCLAGCNQDTAKNKTPSAQKSETTETSQSAQEQSTDAVNKSLNSSPAVNDNPNHQPEIARALQDNLNKTGVNATVQSVIPTDMPDMYWATLDNASPVFVDKTGTYVIQGTVMALGGDKPVDISSAMMSKATVRELNAVDKSEMIIFPAKGETKAAIYVFSDPTCHYCQLLHKEIEQTNAAGIEVRYLAWPRGEQLIDLTERVWCSADRNTAITEAKRGQDISASACDNPVRKHMALGYKLGVSGTPAIFAENGQQLGGYLPSAELAKQAISNKL